MVQSSRRSTEVPSEFHVPVDVPLTKAICSSADAVSLYDSKKATESSSQIPTHEADSVAVSTVEDVGASDVVAVEPPVFRDRGCPTVRGRGRATVRGRRCAPVR